MAVASGVRVRTIGEGADKLFPLVDVARLVSGKRAANARRDVGEVIHKFDTVGHGVGKAPNSKLFPAAPAFRAETPVAAPVPPSATAVHPSAAPGAHAASPARVRRLLCPARGASLHTAHRTSNSSTSTVSRRRRSSAFWCLCLTFLLHLCDRSLDCVDTDKAEFYAVDTILCRGLTAPPGIQFAAHALFQWPPMVVDKDDKQS